MASGRSSRSRGWITSNEYSDLAAGVLYREHCVTIPKNVYRPLDIDRARVPEPEKRTLRPPSRISKGRTCRNQPSILDVEFYTTRGQ